MCGIIAIYCFSQTNQKTKDDSIFRIKKSCKALHHRGPDESDVWVSEDGQIALGHTRLSIIDVDGGKQPMRSSDGEIYAVVNGEFYDFECIRAQLQSLGYLFKTQSDSEILLYLYKEYGTECLKYLRGEFAFVLIDNKNKILFAARDRFGIKPLYYTEYKGELFFSSEIKGIIAAGVPAVWNKNSYLSRSFCLDNSTMFKGIETLEPGYFFICDTFGHKKTKYWDLDYPKLHDVSPVKDELEIISQVHDLLLESVNLRLHADVPVAFYLSGGLDSSAILGLAASIHKKPLTAFNISFIDDPSYNEQAKALEMAVHAGANLKCIEISADNLSDRFEQAVWHNEGPIFNAHGIAKLILSERVHDAGYKVVLTGEGADEIFAGYPHFRKDFLISSWLGRKAGNDCRVTWTETEKSLARTLSQFVPTHIFAEFEFHEPLHLLLSQPGIKEKIIDYHPVDIASYLWVKSNLPKFVLTTLGDRMEMAHSIEGRVPFLDHHLAEFVARLPLHFKIREKVQKYILREVAKIYLPQSCYHQKKHYFEAPPMLINPNLRLYQLCYDTIMSNVLESIPFIDAQKVRENFRKLYLRPKEELWLFERIIMEIVSLCFLQTSYRLSY